MCIRDRARNAGLLAARILGAGEGPEAARIRDALTTFRGTPVSYTHLRAHETVLDLVCRLLLEKKNQHYVHYSSRAYRKP